MREASAIAARIVAMSSSSRSSGAQIRKGIMYRCADFDTAFGCQAGGQSHHFSAVRLHWKIPQAPWVWFFSDVDLPTEDGVQRVRQHRSVERCVRPAPAGLIRLVVV